MNKFIFGIFLIFAISVNANPVTDSIVNALKSGNAKELAKSFNASIDLNIPNNEGVYSKSQAELILKTFFSKNQPKSFEVIHTGDSKNETHYSIGKLSTSSSTFRTYILYKKKGDTISILELRIEVGE